MTGQTVSHYRIVKELGGGGMGVVYRAEDLRLRRPVAVKFLPDAPASSDARERFEREARAASAINHPNICTVHDVGEHEGRQFLVMELLEGQTLKHRIADGPVSLPALIDWAMQIADALAAAHERGIVHRDIKPANLFVTSRGQVKVLDFGLAKADGGPSAMDGASETHTEFHTVVGTTLGTVHYMSPEQARGEVVDARTDLFSLGVVLYEMATGRQPFSGATSAVVFEAILNRNPEPPARVNRSLPAELDAIIRKAMEKDRRLRYQTASDLLADLARLKRDSSADHTGASAPPRGPRPSSRILYAVAALVVILSAAGVWWWTRQPSGPAAAPVSELRVVRLTGNPSERAISGAAISPDGKYLAYSDARGISLRVMDTPETQLLPDTKGLGVAGWYPDSARIVAVDVAERSQTFAVSILGRRQRVPPGLPSPDGRLLLRYAASKLIVSSADGTGARDLVTLMPRDQLSGLPRWSLDGKHVLYAVWSVGPQSVAGGHLYSASVTDGTPTLLVRREGAEIGGVVSAPGNRVLFAAIEPSDTPGVYSLFELRLNERGGAVSEPRRLTSWPETLHIPSMTITADGKRLTCLRIAGQYDVLVSQIKDGNIALGSAQRLTLDDRHDMPTDWTPDGRVLFSSSRNGTMDVFAQRPGEEDAELLVGTPAPEDQPRATPDGKWILFVGADEKMTRLLRMPVEGGPAVEVLRSADFRHHRCGRRALCVVVEQKDRVDVVYELDPMKGRGRELFRKPPNTGDPAISPDGQRIAFLVEPAANVEPAGSGESPVAIIRVVDRAGRTELELPISGYAAVESLDWTADGTGFITVGYSLVSPNESALLHVSLDGTLTPLQGEPGLFPRWAIPSFDGRSLAIFGTIFDRNVWMVEGL
jgi:serine/threonine protein kinase/Tol biopolymer transport system component